MPKYWEGRHELWIKNQDRDDAAVARKLQSEYKRTARELEKDIARYFQQYGQDNVIEFRTMMLDLSQADKDLLFQDMEAFANRYPEYADLLPVRESIYRLNRLQGLHYSTQLKLLELGAIEQKELEKHLEKTYGKHYKNMLQELGIGNQFLTINEELMKDTIYAKWVNGENFSDRIWKNKESLLNHLQTTYRDGLAGGDNYHTLTRNIMKRFDVSYNDARRLVWTEASFVYNQSHTQAYENAGIEEYQLDAFLDSRTSEICREMDGKRFRFDEMEVGVNFPPFHPWCRTTFIGVDLRDRPEDRQEIRYDNTKEAFKAVRYTSIEKEFAEQMDQRLLDLANNYPIDTEEITVRSLKNTGNAIGYHRFGFKQRSRSSNEVVFSNEIVYSNQYMQNESAISSVMNRIANSRGGKNRNPHILATVDHEYAHAIDTAYAIRKADLRDLITKWDGGRFITQDDVDEISHINRSLRGKHSLSYQMMETMKKEYGIKDDTKFFKMVDEELGSYAASNKEELLAEGFSAYRHIPEEEHTEFLKKFGEHFNKLFWEVF